VYRLSAEKGDGVVDLLAKQLEDAPNTGGIDPRSFGM
jgi:hypothetical protein